MRPISRTFLRWRTRPTPSQHSFLLLSTHACGVIVGRIFTKTGCCYRHPSRRVMRQCGITDSCQAAIPGHSCMARSFGLVERLKLHITAGRYPPCCTVQQKPLSRTRIKVVPAQASASAYNDRPCCHVAVCRAGYETQDQ